jgi:hypothetical protein
MVESARDGERNPEYPEKQKLPRREMIRKPKLTALYYWRYTHDITPATQSIMQNMHEIAEGKELVRLLLTSHTMTLKHGLEG